MKNQLQPTGLTFISRVACAAKRISLNSFKSASLFVILLCFAFSSFGKGSGCGAWNYKNKNDRKYKNHLVKLYKVCPGGVCVR